MHTLSNGVAGGGATGEGVSSKLWTQSKGLVTSKSFRFPSEPLGLLAGGNNIGHGGGGGVGSVEFSKCSSMPRLRPAESWAWEPEGRDIEVHGGFLCMCGQFVTLLCPSLAQKFLQLPDAGDAPASNEQLKALAEGAVLGKGARG